MSGTNLPSLTERRTKDAGSANPPSKLEIPDANSSQTFSPSTLPVKSSSSAPTSAPKAYALTEENMKEHADSPEGGGAGTGAGAGRGPRADRADGEPAADTHVEDADDEFDAESSATRDPPTATPSDASRDTSPAPARHPGFARKMSVSSAFSDASTNTTSYPERNQNPSASSHTHPFRLPFNKRRGNMRTASVDSFRSLEDAIKHPFRIPGHKQKEEQAEEWLSIEEKRLQEDEKKEKHWKRWGPYLSERQWATVREDYSGNGDAWTHFPHDHARSRTFRWGEDGIGGLSDNHGKMCFALALWNGQDPILKERLFGLTGHQGNHAEDVKELYYYLDSTPTHSYMKFLYKYPQRCYPYDDLVQENARRGRDVIEYEILDTDAFDDDRYWDVFVEYAKDADSPEGVSIRITAYNRGPDPATLHLIPQLWLRNTWAWDKERPSPEAMPYIKEIDTGVIEAHEEHLGTYYFYANSSPAPVDPESVQPGAEVTIVDEVVTPELLFTSNDTNKERLYGVKNEVPYVKDAFHDHIIPGHRPPLPRKAPAATDTSSPDSGADLSGRTTPTPQNPHPEGLPEEASGTQTPQIDNRTFVNPDKTGTKAGAHYTFKDVPPHGGCVVVRLKLTPKTSTEDPSSYDEELFDTVIEERRTDADEYYSRFNSGALSDDLRNIMRQALSGMLWSKQFYMFKHKQWIEGDPGQPPPPPERKNIRNGNWKHLWIEDILSMPDKWEYPFFAIWDTAFHCIPLAMVDPAFAKKQLDIMTREWYMKPDGALPAYEWNFSDVNPPVHAWATFRVFKLERKMRGREDLQFLERVFQKLLLNFTWWVNRKDAEGDGVFEGGFLGLDNISPFNRSERLPTGGTMRQADGTGWMGFYSLSMLNIALELAKHNRVYEDIASKFFEHFLFISDAMTYQGEEDLETSLWNDEEGFYFDAISWGPKKVKQLKVKSLVGLIPLYATLTLEPAQLNKFPGFKKRLEWFIANRTQVSSRNIASMSAGGKGDRRLLAFASEDRLRRILDRMLDEKEFLSPYGIRSLSLDHKEHPYKMEFNGVSYDVPYWPGDSHSGMFGGNSNWRGPIWLATTFLLIESLQRFYQYYGSSFKIECPTGSGDEMNLANVADEIQHRIIHIFARDAEGNRACNGGSEKLNKDPHFKDYLQFHEFFHADTGKGLGASHQTGWTGLVAYFIWATGTYARLPRTPRTPGSAMQTFLHEVPPTPAGSDVETEYSDFPRDITTSDISPEDL